MLERITLLEVERGVRVELRTYATREGAPPLVLVRGLGGCAGRDRLSDELCAHFTVVTMSPRNSGGSDGQLTLDNLRTDLAQVLQHVEQAHGVRPFLVAHSMGAHVAARLLGDGAVAVRAVLLAPLLDITEQNPDVMNWYFRRSLQQRRVPAGLRWVGAFYTTFIAPPSPGARPTGLSLAQQRFDHAAVLPFLESVFGAPRCTTPLRVPTCILLAGKSNAGITLRHLDALASSWRALQGAGSELHLHPDLDHFFSHGGGFFTSSRTADLVARVTGFLLPNPA